MEVLHQASSLVEHVDHDELVSRRYELDERLISVGRGTNRACCFTFFSRLQSLELLHFTLHLEKVIRGNELTEVVNRSVSVAKDLIRLRRFSDRLDGVGMPEPRIVER